MPMMLLIPTASPYTRDGTAGERMFLSVGHEGQSAQRIRIGRLELRVNLKRGKLKNCLKAEIGKLLRR